MMDFIALKKALAENITRLKDFDKKRDERILELRRKLEKKFPIKGNCCESVEEELVKRFPEKIASGKDAKDYAFSVLKDKTVCSADGSQLYCGKFINIPLVIIQTAYFLNNHNGEYEKKVFTNLHILDEDEYLRESKIGFLRFRKEADTFINLMEKNRFLIFDGSLIVSFATQFSDELKKGYIGCVNDLLEKAKEKACVIFGYIDTSYAKEIVDELSGVNIQDALLFKLNYGERSSLFISYRDVTKEYKYKVGFFYGRANSNRLVRVEIPEFCFNKVDEIWQVVLAQCIINKGYPYVIDRSHEACVITEKDKKRFFKLLCRTTLSEDMNLEFSKKTISKINS